MLTDAARGGSHPRAPRSFRSWRREVPGRGAFVLLATAALAVASAGCGDQGPTLPEDASYSAELSGANERPPRSTSGRGTARFVVAGRVASYEVEVADLTGPPTVVHLLIGGRDVAVGQPVVRLSLVATSGPIAKGTIDLRGAITFNNTTISGDSLRALFDNGNAHVNVHTAAYPGGEVRGQVVRGR